MFSAEASKIRSFLNFPGRTYEDFKKRFFITQSDLNKLRLKREEKEENQEKKISILSFDGGGSKGIMEVFILKDVFDFLTILKQDPTALKFLLNPETSLDTKEGRKELRRLLDNCEEPIHPTEAFDFIVGTSVGSLIAFGLVGGKKTEQKRTSMEVEEIIQMFKDCTPRMFDTKAHTGLISWIIGKVKGIFLPFPAIPYSQEGLEEFLKEKFKDLYLTGVPRPHGCVAGAVAKSIDHKTGVAGNEVLFTTRGVNDMHKVVDVLKASSAAPIYFETPVMIGDEAYIDGGDGGNCPLAQALEAIPEIFGKHVEVGSILSIAPPRTVTGPIPEDNQWMYWLSYFPSQVTDGAAVYHHVTESHRQINCQRLFPKSEEGKKFKLDEKNVEAMISCMKNEAIEDKSYFTDIIQAAFKIYLRLDKPAINDVRLQLCQHLFKANPKVEFAHLWLEMAVHDCASSFDIAEIKEELADCYVTLDKYDEAIKYYKESFEEARLQLQPEHKAILNNKIGACYQKEGYCNIAKGYFKETERMIINQEIKSPLTVAETYYNLGACDLEVETFDEAIDYYKKSLGWIEEHKEKFQSPEFQEKVSKVIVRPYIGLGNCYIKQEEFVEAEDKYTKSMTLLNQQLKVKPDDTELKLLKARIRNNIAICDLMNGKHDEAVQAFEDILKNEMKIRGIEDSAGIAISRTNLGNCYIKKRDYNKAIEEYNKSHRMNYSIFGGNAPIPCMAETHNNLGISFLMSGDREDTAKDGALTHFKKSLKIKKKLFGETPRRSVARTYNNMGRLYMMGKNPEYKEAIDYHTKSLEMKIEIYGDDPSHPSIAVSYQNLSECYQATGDEENARSYFQEIEKVDAEELLEGDFF